MRKGYASAAFLLMFAYGHAMADFAHGRDAFLEGRFQEAFEIFQSAAQTGDAKSQIGLGLMLTWGKGTDKNLFAAYQWFDRVTTRSDPVHRVVRILARTNRDYLAKQMSVGMLADAETVAALRTMQDYAAPDGDTAIPIVITCSTAPLARFNNTLQPNSTTLATSASDEHSADNEVATKPSSDMSSFNPDSASMSNAEIKSPMKSIDPIPVEANPPPDVGPIISMAAPTSPNANKLPVPTTIMNQTRGKFLIQLASFKSHVGAKREWARIQATWSEIFGEKKLVVEIKTIPNRGTYHRVQAADFDSLQEAQSVCSILHSEKQACFPFKGS